MIKKAHVKVLYLIANSLGTPIHLGFRTLIELKVELHFNVISVIFR